MHRTPVCVKGRLFLYSAHVWENQRYRKTNMKPHEKVLWGLLCFPASLENLLVFSFILSWFVQDSQSPRGPAEVTPGWKDRFCLYVNGCVSDWQRDVTCVSRPSLNHFWLTYVFSGACMGRVSETLHCSVVQLSSLVNPVIMGRAEKSAGYVGPLSTPRKRSANTHTFH